MQYLLLIYDNEKDWETLAKPEYETMMADYNALSADLAKSGKLVGGNRLQPVANATTVRIRNGKNQITDGPFAETREQLGGYYLVEANDLDEATKLALRIPSARIGSIEIRPVWAMQ
ncbi:MAG TPA: YciI family protein [Kofleriaceae bacterium]|jgi:hypothetical protein